MNKKQIEQILEDLKKSYLKAVSGHFLIAAESIRKQIEYWEKRLDEIISLVTENK